ncbi:hypothetical protein AB0B89_18350 [Sphaerisporangium sp. NPDC049002]|uniref:hypothetical protein n=1 Tax=Sphaerisporangium sp. NPDC049002 TaxID=3155392 RepID=UPI0033D7AB46
MSNASWLYDPHYREDTNRRFPPIFTTTEELARKQREEAAKVKQDPRRTDIRQRPADRGHWAADRAIDLLAKTSLTEAQKARLLGLL